jgi:hypothetical protein
VPLRHRRIEPVINLDDTRLILDADWSLVERHGCSVPGRVLAPLASIGRKSNYYLELPGISRASQGSSGLANPSHLPQRETRPLRETRPPSSMVPEKARKASLDRHRSASSAWIKMRGYALAASSDPKGRKYCVPLIGSVTFLSNCCRSSFLSTKSISEVFTISRSDEV